MNEPLPPIGRHRSANAMIVVLVVLSFLIGMAVMGYVARQRHRLVTDRPTAVPLTAIKEGATPDFEPAASLGIGGEAPPVVAVTDPGALMTREAALAAQLSTLETRTAAVTADAAVAETQASRAESLLVAFAARRAVDRGQPLGYLEEQLRTRFGRSRPRAVNAVIMAAREPVTLEDLRQGLDVIAADVSSSAAGDRNWWDGLRRELGTLIVLRKANTPSPMPAERLDRARRLLIAGQVDAARAEIERLPGADKATNWMAAARRYVVARQALDAIESAAILGQGISPPVVPAAPAGVKPKAKPAARPTAAPSVP